jgi:hypothetical protein
MAKLAAVKPEIISTEEKPLPSKVWNFQTQLKVGERGQELFQEAYPTTLEVYPQHDGDFIEVESGKKLELKTDTYNMTKTENFFVERWSSLYDEKPGSFWQAYGHGCQIFCYMFVRHNTWFQFGDIPAAMDKVEKMTATKGYIYIKNRAWITAGYKIPREALSDLYEVYEFLPGETARNVTPKKDSKK